VFLIREFSAAGSHLSASSIPRRGPPVRALTPPGTTCRVTLHLAATLPCTCTDKAALSERRRSKHHCPSASASASLHYSHLATSHHLASRVAPLPFEEANAEPVRSLVSPLPHLLREPLCCVERSAVMLLPLKPLSSLRVGHHSSPCSSPPPRRFCCADA
jgi:hypothetical protein